MLSAGAKRLALSLSASKRAIRRSRAAVPRIACIAPKTTRSGRRLCFKSGSFPQGSKPRPPGGGHPSAGQAARQNVGCTLAFASRRASGDDPSVRNQGAQLGRRPRQEAPRTGDGLRRRQYPRPGRRSPAGGPTGRAARAGPTFSRTLMSGLAGAMLLGAGPAGPGPNRGSPGTGTRKRGPRPPSGARRPRRQGAFLHAACEARRLPKSATSSRRWSSVFCLAGLSGRGEFEENA
jgi:hypothetical protein